jgi:hypothetical protein
MKLSVVINTKNAQRYLKQCLTSVKKIADEIVIVDMKSTDKTLAIAAKFTTRIWQFPHPEIGYADPAREFAFAKARGEWILMIDADEELKPPLATLIRQVVDGVAVTLPPADAYFIARSNIIFDKALTKSGWWPDYQLRLWRAQTIKWQPHVHAVPKILGSVAHFPDTPAELAIVHHNYQTVEQFIERTNKYTTLAAETISNTAKTDKTPVSPQTLWQSFWDEWWKRAFAEAGLLEGNHGIVLSLLQASAELQTQAKRWQAEGFRWQELTPRELRRLRRRWWKEAHYWWADLMIRQTHGWQRFYWQWRRKFKC